MGGAVFTATHLTPDGALDSGWWMAVGVRIESCVMNVVRLTMMFVWVGLGGSGWLFGWLVRWLAGYSTGRP